MMNTTSTDGSLPTELTDSAGSQPVESNATLEAVMNGQRFVIVPYVFSLILWTSQRSMGGVHVVKTGEWPMRQLFGAACITSLFGWCGIPRGIPWTIVNLIYLWRGGRDVTLLLLTPSVGIEEARRILATAPKPKPPASIWYLRLLILVPLAILTVLLLCILIPPPWF